MSEVQSMSAAVRVGSGKGAARATRRAGRVPAVIYGDRQDPVTVTLDPRDVKRALQRTAFFSTLLDVELDGAKHRVLPRDVQFHPVSDEPWHVDFLRVGANTQVTVAVPVVFLGEEECPGLRLGGVLTVVRHEIEVVCRADSIPAIIEVPITDAEIGDSIHFSVVTLPEGVAPTITDRDFTIATISAPTLAPVEEEEEAEEGAEGVEGEAEGEAAAEGETTEAEASEES